MNVKEMVVTSVLALATGLSAASMASGYPAQQLPLFFLQFPTMDPATDSCDGVCKSPPTEHPGDPASVNANTVAIGPLP
jgi:hypothetical protein